jgi:MFS family permease
LGVGEAVGYPAYSKLISLNFPEEQRGFANALIDAGSRTGPAIGVLGGGLIAAAYGWRVLFFVVGGVGLLWLVPWIWYLWRHPSAVKAAVRATRGPGLGSILKRRQAWGTFLGLFCLNYSWYFALNWLPIYLTSGRHFTTREMAVYGSLPFWGIAATSVTCGWISDRAIRSGANPTRVRLGFVAGGLVLNVTMMAAYLIPNPTMSIGLLVFASLALGLSSSNCWAVTQTLAGTDAVGMWTGLQNGFGNLAGIIGSYLTGWLIAKSGSFFWAFAVTSALALTGACSYLFLVRRVEEIAWRGDFGSKEV